MKKLLRKVAMVLCTMAVTVGFIGGSVEEASAASYGGSAKVSIQFPGCLSEGRLTVSSSCGGSTSANVSSFVNSNASFYIKGYSHKKNDYITLTAKFVESRPSVSKKAINGKITVELKDSIKVKAKDLKKYNYKITFKKSGNYVNKIYIKKVKK